MKYGYATNIADTPSDNVWTKGREIELKDGTIVYGVEGETLQGATVIGTAQQFNDWRKLNGKIHQDTNE